MQCEKEPLDENAPTFKDTLLDICDQRQDDWSKEVFLRLQAVMTTLPAYDGRYHLDCFYAFRRISKDSRNAETSRLLIDASLKCVVDLLKETSSTLPTYTLSELHDCYMKALGYLSKKQMMNNLSQYFGEELVVLHVPGCETEIGLHKNLGRTLKIVRKHMCEEDDEIDELVRRIDSEVTSLPLPRNYDLSDFQFKKIVEDTSPTLLKFIA